jgi:hypothetical protein
MRFQINIYRPGKKPKKVPKPRGEERRISVAILIPLMFLLLLGISFAYMRASSSLDRRMHMNRRQKTYLYGQLKEVESDLEKAAEERGLISKLRVRRVEWFPKLMDLSKIMPDDLWLTDLSVKTTEKRKKGSREVEKETYLIIKGATVPVLGQERADSIAQLISSLNSLDSFQRDFDTANLVNYTHLSRGKERKLMEFEISAKLKGVPGASGGKASK